MYTEALQSEDEDKISMDIYLRQDLETVVDIILLTFALLVLYLGCRGMMRSGIRQKKTYIYITVLGIIAGIIELFDVLELVPRSIFARTVIGTSEILVLFLLIFALYQFHQTEKK